MGWGDQLGKKVQNKQGEKSPKFFSTMFGVICGSKVPLEDTTYVMWWSEWRVRESRRREQQMCGCEEWIMGTPQPMSFIHVLGWNRFNGTGFTLYTNYKCYIGPLHPNIQLESRGIAVVCALPLARLTHSVCFWTWYLGSWSCTLVSMVIEAPIDLWQHLCAYRLST